MSLTDEAVDPLSQALEDAICSMKLGEKCEITLPMDTTLGLSPLLTGAPPDCHLLYSIYLISFERAPEVWSLSDQSREMLALQHKATGNEQFRVNNIYGASLHYSKALKYVICIHTHWDKAKTLKRSLHSNLAACQLKLKQYTNVVQNSSLVLEGSVDVKALYRRGLALAAMKDFEAAKDDFVRVLDLEPNNKAVTKQLHELELKVRAHNSKMKDALKKMFS